MSSPYGDELIGWHINNGKDQEADFYTAIQFERILYRPDYVLAYFHHRGDPKKASHVLKGQAFDINKLESIAPPKVEVLSPYNSNHVYEGKYRLRMRVEKRSLPMKSYTVFINGIPVTPSSERVLSGGEQDAFTRELEIQPLERENKLRVEVFNGISMGLAQTTVYYDGPELKKQKGDLYLLTVGINHFFNMPSDDLTYAVSDAVNVAKTFQIQEGKAFNRVHAMIISDRSQTKPLRQHILDHLDFVRNAKAEDTVILYLASHGLSDPAGNYFFIPADAEMEDIHRIVEACQRGGPIGPIGRTPSLIRWETFFDALRSAAGKRILIVDTCQAQRISGTLDIHSLAKRSVTSSFALLASSQGDEPSQEYPAGKQGLFTYAILKALSGGGDRNKDGKVLLAELYDFVREFVEKKRNRLLGKQTPHLASPEGLKEMALAAF
jgi:hypothetical protein